MRVLFEYLESGISVHTQKYSHMLEMEKSIRSHAYDNVGEDAYVPNYVLSRTTSDMLIIFKHPLW